MKQTINTTVRKSMSYAKGLLSASLCILFLSGCEHMGDLDDIIKDGDDDKDKEMKYTAYLSPLNNSGVTGTAKIMMKEDGKFQVIVEASNMVPNMVHPQHIHGFVMEDKNATCPDPSAAGEDGLLTLADGLPAYGPVIVPLDDQLVPLSVENFPNANAGGNLSYVEKVDTRALVSAFDAAYEGTQTMANLKLDKRVIVLHGAYVKDNMVVPAGTEGAEYIATLPVACGEIVEKH
ncbi:hypothetical protein [Pontibacter kalidii]|uniref:hypothetical protein n=1 Tax=Pontibacter kalidii TaxID=2592049 RepID=UPI0022586FBB|nr:hypothetical protein [Pontibacter kalidii]